jgi:hypothetical protein
MGVMLREPPGMTYVLSHGRTGGQWNMFKKLVLPLGIAALIAAGLAIYGVRSAHANARTSIDRVSKGADLAVAARARTCTALVIQVVGVRCNWPERPSRPSRCSSIAPRPGNEGIIGCQTTQKPQS